MSKNYTTKTAALNVIVADIHKVSADVLTVGGKEVATEDQLIVEVKHSQDTRETVTENDLWSNWAEIKDGTVIVHDDEVVNPNKDNATSSLRGWNANITKVENNKAYVGDTLYGNIQTEKIKNGTSMFEHCTRLTTFDSDLSSLINGHGMFSTCNSLTSFTLDLPSLIDGTGMFSGCTNLTSFPSDLRSLIDGSTMFRMCKGPTSFDSDLSSLTDGGLMFDSCKQLTTFTSDLSSLVTGSSMFQHCSNLTTFTSNLSSLQNGIFMFSVCEGLTSFSSDLRSLINGYAMFSECTNLTSFTGDLRALVNGESMFDYCPNLTSFTGDLSSLINGNFMFYESKLDSESLLHIAESIRDVRDLTNGEMYLEDYEIKKEIYLGLGRTPTEEDVEYLTEIYNKGWEVFVMENIDEVPEQFEPTANIPLDDQGETTTPTPYWAKPKEVNEKNAKYIGEDGKYYIILGGNHIFVSDPETYGLFTSLEDAAANMRLTKLEKKTNKQ